jgi:putative transposase
MFESCKDADATLTEFNGVDHHVQLLVQCPSTVQVSTPVNSLKGMSARVLNKEFPRHISKFLWGGHLWSLSYFAGFCGGASVGHLRVHRSAEAPAVSKAVIVHECPPGQPHVRYPDPEGRGLRSQTNRSNVGSGPAVQTSVQVPS